MIMEDDKSKKSFLRKPWVQSLAGIVLIVVALFGILYWKSTSSYVAIDMSQISAPIIAVGPESEGVLSEVYVKPGDTVVSDEPLARVGGETLSAKTSGDYYQYGKYAWPNFYAGKPGGVHD